MLEWIKHIEMNIKFKFGSEGKPKISVMKMNVNLF